MANKDLTYQEYSPGDEKGIVDLLCMVFPKWKEANDPLNIWIWKHLKGPHLSDIYVAKDGNLIVGVAHRVVSDIKIGDSILLSQYGDDLAVHPDYREHGIWKNLLNFGNQKQVSKGIKYHYLATENPIVKENIIKMGFTPSKLSMSHLLKIRDQEAFLKRKERNNLVMRVGVAALTGLGEVKQFFSSDPSKNADFSIIDAAKFDQRIDALWERVKDGYDYCIVKNSKYLNWKHALTSESGPKLRFAVKNEEVLGYSVLSLREYGDYREGSITDLLALPDSPEVADALIRDACEYFNRENVAAIYYQATKGHPYEGLAGRNGFIDASRQVKTDFYYRIINNSIKADYLDTIDLSRVQLNYF